MIRTTRLTTTAVLLSAALAACGSSDGGTAGPTPSPSTSTAPTTAPTQTPRGTLHAVPVYWVAQSRDAFALYREFRDVPDLGDAVTSAVAAMTRMRPLDPDYSTPWRPASSVRVTRQGTALTVDLSRDALASTQVGSELAARAVQQLVYTATAASGLSGTPATTVRVLVDGRSTDAWGAVRLGEPTTRAPMGDVQAQAWVTSPQQGQRLPAGPVRFTGFGTSFEATFAWKVTSSTGVVVAHGSAMGGTGDGRYGELTWQARLAPGSYTVTLSTDDPSDGAGPHGPATDDKAFTVS